MAINQAVERRDSSVAAMPERASLHLAAGPANPDLDIAALHHARIANEGLACHPHATSLAAAAGPEAARDLADAVHLLCALYGRHPGLVELALGHAPPGPVREWLVAASEGFERERLYLVRLSAAVGPLPSTPGSAETQSVLGHQRHALETLALSERRGCALGATTALVGDWRTVRAVLDRAAARMSVDVPACTLPGAEALSAILHAGIDNVGAQRALGFGADQLLLQNRGLFDLLEARAAARANF